MPRSLQNVRIACNHAGREHSGGIQHLDESHRLLQAHSGTTQARRCCKAFRPGFTGPPRCITSYETRTACPGQPVSTLTAADLRPYRSKALRHKMVPDAVLTAFRHSEHKVPCRHSVQSRRPSRRIQVRAFLRPARLIIAVAASYRDEFFMGRNEDR